LDKGLYLRELSRGYGRRPSGYTARRRSLSPWRWPWSQEHPVGWAADAGGSSVEDVSVDHCGAHVSVAEQLLDGSDVLSVLQQMSREGVTERVARGQLHDAGCAYGLLDGPLQDRLVKMMTAALSSVTVDVESRGRKEPLPAPVPPRVRVFAGERERKLDPSRAAMYVGRVLFADAPEMIFENGLHRGRQHRCAVLAALAIADDDPARGEIDIFDS